MEAILVIIAILALIGGSAAVLARQGGLPWTLPTLPALGGRDESRAPSEVPSDAAREAGREPAPLAPAVPVRPAAARAHATPSGATAEPIRLDLVQTHGETTAARLDRIEARLEELQREVARHHDHAGELARRIHAELVSRADAEQARREAAQERLRGDVLAAVSRVVAERQPGVNARRMEVSAELYAQLARFEAALATVTNPILLPGEPYAPPAELLPESLIWENWNEVGERAFALAETYSAQRLHLSGQARADVGAFVTTVRTLLTRSVYPNVQGEADAARQAALRGALSEIAAELPTIRDLLETEYLEGRSG